MSNDKNILTKTNDGYVVELFAKDEIKNEFFDIAEGLSILKIDNNENEDEQYLSYKKIIEKMNYRPIIVNALEIEKNIKTQLRAILRASKDGDVSIVFSKIATVDEMRQYKEFLEECKSELEIEKIPYKKHIKIGAVVEIPSAALMSYGIAKECDFLFIDINSLTNYTFGMKKNNKESKLYEKFQPGVIKLVKHTIEGAHDAGIFCGICGDVVENNLYMPLLIGLGLDQFSMNANYIEVARKMISELDKTECKYLVEEILQLRTIENIEKKLKQFIQN